MFLFWAMVFQTMKIASTSNSRSVDFKLLESSKAWDELTYCEEPPLPSSSFTIWKVLALTKVLGLESILTHLDMDALLICTKDTLCKSFSNSVWKWSCYDIQWLCCSYSTGVIRKLPLHTFYLFQTAIFSFSTLDFLFPEAVKERNRKERIKFCSLLNYYKKKTQASQKFFKVRCWSSWIRHLP